MTDDECERCGARVVKTRSAVYNADPALGLFHRQSCTDPAPIKNSETVEQVRRSSR